MNAKLKATNIRTDIVYSHKLLEEIIGLERLIKEDIHINFCKVCFDVVDKTIYYKECFITDYKSNDFYCDHNCVSIDNVLLEHPFCCLATKYCHLT